MLEQPAQTYEALLSKAQFITQVRAAQRAIESVGGTLQVIPNHQPGLTLIVLTLPASYRPEVFFPGIPFYLV
jgi:hypothetical protein